MWKQRTSWFEFAVLNLLFDCLIPLLLALLCGALYVTKSIVFPKEFIENKPTIIQILENI